MHPGETIDIVLEGRIFTPSYELSFFKDTGGKSPCGKGTRSSDIILPFAPYSNVQNVKTEVGSGIIKALVWEGAKVADSAAGRYAICLCDYTYFLGVEKKCSLDYHYNLHAGWVNVKGEALQPLLSCAVRPRDTCDS